MGAPHRRTERRLKPAATGWLGAAIQSLYLLATEMGLACSAIGGGDSGLFAAATALDPLVETSVAEFAVGSRGRSANALR